jgi:hypothetical protein
MIAPEAGQEWRSSCVDEDIIKLNVLSLAGRTAYDYLLYSDRLTRLNTGVLSRSILKQYAFLDHGGWWCSGVDPLNDWQPMEWGCFKPRRPRLDFEKRKVIKYEHPAKIETRAFFLRVSWRIGLEVARKAGKTEEYEQRILQAYSRLEAAQEKVKAENKGFGASIKINRKGHESRNDLHSRIGRVASSDIWSPVAAVPEEFLSEQDSDFWKWVHNDPKIPLTLTEGAKKAGALLTAGFAAIALPGIYSGYRQRHDEEGNRIGKPFLIPDLQHFATPGREIYFCFDRDSKQKTIRNTCKAIERTGYLFTQFGCKVRVISWQQPQKGVDDFIAAYGTDAFEQVYQSAQLLEAWQARSFSQLTYGAALEVNQRYLDGISIPEQAKLVALKSPKGSGKTQFLESVVSEAIANGQWVLVIGHRVQLVEALCHRFGISYVTEVRSSETGALLGFGLCIDSLHPKSQARFNAQNWHNGVVIIDECEQVIWHALNSSTCQSDRVSILRQLKTLLSNVLQGNGRVFLADADLSDVSIDFVKAQAGVSFDPWVVLNNWHPGESERCNIFHYDDADPSGLVAALETHIATGGRPLVVCSAQKAKSKWSTRTLEAYFKKQFPTKRILRIDSESIADPSHPAYGVIAHLNQTLGNYDIVLASPSIETGVSVDVKGHFTSCWGIFQGVQSESSARQALFRLRESVERHVWAAPRGIGQVGNGATSIKSLLASQHRLTRANIHLLQDFALDELDLDFQPEALRTWAQMAVRVNLGMVRYRDSILDGLRAEGHQLIAASTGKDDELAEAISATKDANQQAEATAIALAVDITQSEYEQLKDRKAKTQDQRYQERKYSLKQRYAVPVTPELVLKDDDGWYPQMRLHYYATVGRAFLKQRDTQRARAHFERGNGAAFLPDFNRGQLATAVALLEHLGVLALTDGREVAGADEALQQLASLAYADRWTIKAVLGVSLNEADTPIAIAQKLLSKCGLKLTAVGRKGSRNDRQRVYQYIAPADGREEVFAAWLARDEAAAPDRVASTPASSLVSTPGNKEYIITPPLDTKPEFPPVSNSRERAGVIALQKVSPSVSTPGNKEVITIPPLDTKPEFPPVTSSQEKGQIRAIASAQVTSADSAGIADTRSETWGVGLLMPGSIVQYLARPGRWTIKYCTGIVAKIVDWYGQEEIVSCKYLRLAGIAA